jgi:hypothetical protein
VHQYKNVTDSFEVLKLTHDPVVRNMMPAILTLDEGRRELSSVTIEKLLQVSPLHPMTAGYVSRNLLDNLFCKDQCESKVL